MAAPTYLGEFEFLVLLAVLRLKGEAYAPAILRELDDHAGRAVTRSALYTTLDRLEQKDLLRWKVVVGDATRGNLPRRAYAMTPLGLTSLKASHGVLRRMTRGVEALLGDPT